MMHELGIMDAMIKRVDRLIHEEQLTKVRRIVLEIGELSGVVPHFVTDCYKAVVADTNYQDTELLIEILPGIARCNDCQIEFRINVDELNCPECMGINLTPLSGRDLTIKEIEAY